MRLMSLKYLFYLKQQCRASEKKIIGLELCINFRKFASVVIYRYGQMPILPMWQS